MSHDLRELLEQTGRGPCDESFDPARIAIRARRQVRIAAAAAMVVVLVGVAGGALWVGSLGATPRAPYVESSPPATVSDTWQQVTVGQAQLSVPGSWEVIDLAEQPAEYCTIFEDVPALYLGAAPNPAPACPSRQLDPAVGVQAVGFELLGGHFEGNPVEINGHEGTVTPEDDGIRRYVFPDLAVMLYVHSEPDPGLADQVLATLQRAERSADDPVPPQPSVTPHASATAPPTDFDVGPVLEPDTLPAMSSHGVALQVPAGVVFVGLDGTVHGHLPGAELNIGGPAVHVPGPVPVHLPGEGEDGFASHWVAPSSGSVTSLDPATPLWGGHRVIQLETGLDPSPLVLRHGDGTDSQELARFSPNLPWHVSADHRVVSWHDCPDDPSTCTAHAYDTDMGGEMELDPGCWVSDSFADFNHAVICAPMGTDDEEAARIERHGPGQEVGRIELPRYREQPDDAPSIGQYRNAFLLGDDVVATWGAECEIPIAVVASPDSPPRPLLGDDLATAPTAVVLGTTPDGRAVVHVLAHPACGQPGEAGVHLVNPDTGETTPVILTDSLTWAEMWSPQPA